MKTKHHHPAYGEPLIVNDLVAAEYYDREKVREILINLANSENAMRRDMTAEQIVDGFMESGEEE